ncbi:MAG: helix-turn-helix domain-containing protein [Crocinitomicaceae bacterium]|nr:helix-turn-helix domain-containing protein [Crocinitomicaceae bacterium]
MESFENKYVKRTQRDYSMPFKLAVIKEVQSGEIGINAAMRKYGIQGRDTIRTWIRKYSIFDDDNTSKLNSMKTPQQRIKELSNKYVV